MYLLQSLSLKLHLILQERLRAHLFCRISDTGPSRYGYISNLCVAKSARRQGIGSNMLNFALESAKTTGKKKNYMLAQIHPPEVSTT